MLHSGILPAAELICSRVFVRSTTQRFYMYVCMSMRIYMCVYICIQFVVAARSAVAIFFFIFIKQTTALSETSLTPTAHFERLN